MASIKNSLRKIYAALGGTSSKSKTITGLLDDISTVASSGGGGSDLFISEILFNEDTGKMYLNHTWKELFDAIKAKKFLICVKDGSDILNTSASSYSYYNYVGSVLKGSKVGGGYEYKISLGYIGSEGLTQAFAETENDFPSWED